MSESKSNKVSKLSASPSKTVKGAKPRASAAELNRSFLHLCNAYENFIYKSFPTYGTYMGLTKYDSLLSKPTPAFFKGYIAKLEDFHRRFMAFRPSELSTDNRVDRALALNLLELEIEELKDRPDWKRSPSMYFQEVMYGNYVILTRGGEGLLGRADGIIARTEGLPGQLEHGKKNLDNPPRLYTESAIMSAHGAQFFFDSTLRTLAEKLDAKRGKRLNKACDNAVKAIDEYIVWMKETLLPKSKGEWRAGKSRFNKRLKKYHEVPFEADSLYALGEKVFNSTKSQMAKLAKQIDASKNWEEIVANLKKDHPTNAALVGYYAKEMERARKFVKTNDLVSFPPKEEIKVIETPDFARPLIPYAAYLMPGLYEEEQTGIFWVTTVSKGTPAAQAKEQLEGHSKYGIVVTSLHEAYPGHHLQLTRANMKKRIWRHLHHTSVFAEGWALYCEEMMYEQGFYTDPRVRLLQLKDQLWRACRVMIDVSLHTRRMSFEEAVDFLVEKAHLERPNAEVEVRRYCMSPTQPMSYILGKHLVLDLRDRMKKKLGKTFSLKGFHDALIDHGTIPVSRVEELING